MTINIYNALGMLVKTINTGTNHANIDLSEFASGVYLVKVFCGRLYRYTKSNNSQIKQIAKTHEIPSLSNRMGFFF